MPEEVEIDTDKLDDDIKEELEREGLFVTTMF